MPRYLIEETHDPMDCVKALDNYLRAGAHYMTNTEWGCEAGVHKGWLIFEAENDEEARLRVPANIRNVALLVRLNRFSPDQVRDLHEREAREEHAGGG